MLKHEVPQILLEMHQEALRDVGGSEQERYKIALLGLVNAFEADLHRKGIPVPEMSDAPDVSLKLYETF